MILSARRHTLHKPDFRSPNWNELTLNTILVSSIPFTRLFGGENGVGYFAEGGSISFDGVFCIFLFIAICLQILLIFFPIFYFLIHIIFAGLELLSWQKFKLISKKSAHAYLLTCMSQSYLTLPSKQELQSLEQRNSLPNLNQHKAEQKKGN